MKKLRREINLFTLSALDLFASTMGTFILLTVILFPYYLKNSEVVEQVSILRDRLSESQAELLENQQHLQQCRFEQTRINTQLNQCQEELRQTFLAIVLKWETLNQDIDLHVVDTVGNEFYFERHNRSRLDFASLAELSVDTTRGPGVEIWENPQARLGRYQVFANLYARHGNLVDPWVKSTVYFRGGSQKLPDVALSVQGSKVLIAVIEVNDRGEVVIR